VLAVIPIRGGVLPLGGREVAAECGDHTVLVGTGTTVAAAELSGRVHLAETGEFRPAAWAEAIAAAMRDRAGAFGRESILVLPASPDGRDLAPRLAAALGWPLFAGATAVSPSSVVLARAGGLQMHRLVPPASFVATLQPGVRGVDEIGGAAETSELVLELGRHLDAIVDAVLPPDAATIDLAEAHRILGGGAGLDSPQQFTELAEIGAALQASVGATRVVTDRGWIGHNRQIGTTGVVVHPELYLAFGISGAVQHTSGLGHPHHIVSVNVDPFCPMMQLADLAVVADANAVVRELRTRLGAAHD
jgi:electron transfer flavoprotein alpha subunit